MINRQCQHAGGALVVPQTDAIELLNGGRSASVNPAGDSLIDHATGICENGNVRSKMSAWKRLLLGVVAFTLGAVPVGGLGALVIVSFLDFTLEGWVYTAGFLAIIIAAGLQVPVLLILGVIPELGAPEEERAMSLLRVRRHPFALFEYWWRYLR
jgi:hypothetical protein